MDAFPLEPAAAHSVLTATAYSFFFILFASAIYRLYFSPLSHIPGPLLARISSLYLITLSFFGIEGRVLRAWHLRTGARVLRVGPNSVSISDPDAIRDIYIASGGYLKDERYENFNLGSVVSIFSSRDTHYRDVRAKAVAPLFATGRLRAAAAAAAAADGEDAGHAGGVMATSIAEFVKQLGAFKDAGVRLDLLDLCARLSIDVVTGYLLGAQYGGLAEHSRIADVRERQKAKLSANHFIFAIVAWARFSLLPPWAFQWAYAVYSRLTASQEVRDSFASIEKFISGVVEDVKERIKQGSQKDAHVHVPSDTYHGHLMAAGVSTAEAAAQATVITFAGTDSTAVMLTTILFHLTQNPKARHSLLAEIRASARTNNNITDPQNLPYLRAVIKEGLRLGMANPTRLTRIVPASGLRVGDVFIPPGTVVGCAASTIHYDANVFPDPFRFRPERWLDDGRDEGLHRPNMDRSILAFGAGLRACIGKNLAMGELYEATRAVVDAEILEGARTCQDEIEIVEWFNGEIKGHRLEIEWAE